MEIYNIILRFLEIVLFTSVIINLVVWTSWFTNKACKGKCGYALGPFLFSIHATLFFLATLLGILTYEIYFIWRALVAIHAIILLIAYGILMKRNIEV